MRGRRNDYLADKARRRSGRRGGRGRDRMYYGGNPVHPVNPINPMYYDMPDHARGKRGSGSGRSDYEPMDNYGYEYENYDNRGRMRGRDRAGYDSMDYKDVEQEYEKHLEEWTNKLKHRDKFKMPREQIINQARNMGVRFKDYTEEEFYAIYLAHVTDHGTISEDYNTFIVLAKQFLEDDDMAVTPSEKVCIYLYEIVLGKSKEEEDDD